MNIITQNLKSLFSKIENKEVAIKSLPAYAKASLIMVGLYLFFYTLFVLQDILIPLSFGFLLAILLNPLNNKLMGFKIHKMISISISLIIAILILAGILLLINMQILQFVDMSDQIYERFINLANKVQNWIFDTFGVEKKTQNDKLLKMLDAGSTYIASAINHSVSFFLNIFLVFFYTFMVLYYKPLLLNFIYEIFDDKHEFKIKMILGNAKLCTQKYIVGLLYEMIIIAILTTTTYLIVGLKFALTIGIIGAIINMIPYIGGIIGILLPLFVYFLTGKGDVQTPIIISISYLVIQFIDNYFIVPRIVASKVSINSLFSVIIVLLGNSLWGVSGMFLSLIFIGILKIVFENFEPLNALGKIMGEEVEPNEEIVSD